MILTFINDSRLLPDFISIKVIKQLNKLFILAIFPALLVLSTHAQESDQELITLWLEACDNLKKAHGFRVQGSYDNHFERTMMRDHILDSDLSIYDDTYAIQVGLIEGEPIAFVFTFNSSITDGPNQSYRISERILINEQLYTRSQYEQAPFEQIDDTVQWDVDSIAIFGNTTENLKFYAGLDTTTKDAFTPSLFCFPESSVVNVQELSPDVLNEELLRVLEVTIDRGNWVFEKDKPSSMRPLNDYEIAVIDATVITQQVWISEDGLPYRVETWLNTTLTADRLPYYNNDIMTDISLQHQLHTLLEYSDFNVPFEIDVPISSEK